MSPAIANGPTDAVTSAQPSPSQEGAPPLMTLRGVSKRFGVIQALAGVDLDIRAGEVLALVGENGAGKSTMMRIVEGVVSPDSGALAFDGVVRTLRRASDAHALGVRIIHQEPDIAPDLSVAENLFIGDLHRTMGVFLDRRDLLRRTLALFDKFGLRHSLSPWTRAGDLGAAQRQLVEIMRALRAGVRLLALDEPTSSLTEEETRRLFAIVRQLKASGVAIVYISHRMHEIRELADRIAILRDGRMVTVRTAADLDDTAVLSHMVGRPINNLFDRARREPGPVVLTLDGVTTHRIRDVSFKIKAGEVVGMAGLIGAGRSETAAAIFGADPIVSGKVLLGGATLRLRSPADAIAAGIGYAPEERKAQALFLSASVETNITLCVPNLISHAGFLRAGAAHRIARQQADDLRIKTPHLSQLVAKLSGGNQQKVVLGRWLARQLKMLILDEPTRGIDVGAKAEIYALIRRLADSGLAILVISSEMPELIGLSDRIVVMATGRIVGEVNRADATEEGILALAMTDNINSDRTNP
jgi:L-arabinose transport system ATP-binding protein